MKAIVTGPILIYQWYESNCYWYNFNLSMVINIEGALRRTALSVISHAEKGNKQKKEHAAI